MCVYVYVCVYYKVQGLKTIIDRWLDETLGILQGKTNVKNTDN